MPSIISRRAVLGGIAIALAGGAGARAQSDADTRRALVGTWVWGSEMNGQQVYNELTLAGNGDFAYSTADQAGHLVTQTGKWGYEGGYIGFNTTWSNVKDPSGRYLVLGPIQIVEVGADYVRTTAGIARRKS
jgi:hypothetical protein